ncbi:biotin-dependent carboxyltransferase family protein [Cryobacterium sp. PH31-O1]|uniref:5-oxoprolinase subunit C family protein n=1 Tax=Cryobacterium sp. PH31-O1 TaxID=3046306 RepID=UPI0024BA9369|nr:biotin-dependent carboxyltransferase family protein [Cryobacterium sp. PH31-O1]MDJ0339019.1 biotin-dependent carboxyltransferase family protein [Cryobacterium sp. PH31-O1]
MAFNILEPGLSTTVQDQGRIGYYRFGIPQGGSMDQYAATLANRLVGNTVAEAVLECTYIGPKLVTEADAVIAVTGAPVDIYVNGESVPEYERVTLKAGDELKFGVIKGGTKYFIAVHGGIDVPEVLGSRSTYPIGAIGGMEGRAIAVGDRVPVGASIDNGLAELSAIAEVDRPVYSKDVNVRVMLGLYDHNLSANGLDSLLNSEWVLTPVADRMGLRYSGPGVEWKDRKQPFGAGQDPSNIVDAGYAVGSIQIPGGTQPIILHRDAVSGGGYAMVATVISADMDLVARCSPGTKTRFVAVTMEQALEARQKNAARAARIWS